MNTIGKLYTLTSFGESHGEALGGVIDGCPAGLPLSVDEIQYELYRRRPGQSSVTTSRTEEDRVEILSGVFEGVTTGTPIGFVVRNKDQRSRDYDEIKIYSVRLMPTTRCRRNMVFGITGAGDVRQPGNTWFVWWGELWLVKF